jgi:hypothetical protein
MRTSAGLHANEPDAQVRSEAQQLQARELPAHHDLTSPAHSIKVNSFGSLKDRIHLRRPNRHSHFSLATRRRTIHSELPVNRPEHLLGISISELAIYRELSWSDRF